MGRGIAVALLSFILLLPGFPSAPLLFPDRPSLRTTSLQVGGERVLILVYISDCGSGSRRGATGGNQTNRHVPRLQTGVLS